jgi:polyhydroxybutyrate depolymerase
MAETMIDKQVTLRRLVGIGGMVLALFVLLSVIAYVAYSAQQAKGAAGQSPALTATMCQAPVHQLGDSTATITSGGVQRTFLIHLPPTYGYILQPLLIGYHGYSWTTKHMEDTTQFDGEADKQNFIVVYPQGVDDPPSWNAGVGAYGPTGSADDVQFTRDLLSYLEKNYCVDKHRVYLNGFSLGGGMAYRLACSLSDQIAAVATVSGAYYPFDDGCHPTRPLPVLEIHGMADHDAPYNGNTATHMAAVRDYLQLWLDIDKCSASSRDFFHQGDVTGTEWQSCAKGTEVVHYRIANGGHSWVGSPSLNTQDTVWQFLRQFSH